jgi:predicted metal-dependent peptidase
MSGRPAADLVQRIAAARLWAAHHYPYLASALFASPVVLQEGLGTAAADAAWRVYLDPETAPQWSAEELGGVFVHLSGHLLREHADRALDAGVGDDEALKDRWNLAADAEINDDLPQLRFPAPPVMPGDLGCPDGQLAEQYFRTAQPLAEGSDAECWRCGSAAHGQHEPWERDGDGRAAAARGDSDGVPQSAQKLIRRQVAQEVLSHGKQAGHVPSGLRRWAEALLAGRVDWRSQLAAELRRGITDVAGQVDYSYRRPSRRSSISPDVVLPALRRPVPEVAVVLDTSASMDDRLLGEALAEVDSLLRSVGVGGQAIRVLCVDAAVHSARRVSSTRQIEVFGGGGTDMGKGIEAAVAGRPRPDVVVVLTDGETPWPPAPPPRCRVIVGLLGPRPPAPPGWARSVRITDTPR